MKNKLPAFTVIEIIIAISVIVIMFGVTATVGWSLRNRTLDTQRINDIRAMQDALQDYYNDNGLYPADDQLIIGQSLKAGSKTYLAKIPSSPRPWPDFGTCGGKNYIYKQGRNARSYSITYCLGSQANSLAAGKITVAMPGIIGVQNNVCTCGDAGSLLLNLSKPCCGNCIVSDICGGGVLFAINQTYDGNVYDLVGAFERYNETGRYQYLFGETAYNHYGRFSYNVVVDPGQANHIYWSNSNFGNLLTGANNPQDGAANVASLKQRGLENFGAANFCQQTLPKLKWHEFELPQSNFNDWYLPAANELKMIANAVYPESDGTHLFAQNTQDSLYWTSTEYSADRVLVVDTANGTETNQKKTGVSYHSILCIRRQ